MSRPAHSHPCDRCGRGTPRKRLVPTQVGDLCQHCADRLSKSLRRSPKEARRVP